jgi:hypothetical protein
VNGNLWHVICHLCLNRHRGSFLGEGGPGTGKPDRPKYTIYSVRHHPQYPTYSAFWSVFGATCLRFQRLASPMGFGTTARLGPRENLLALALMTAGKQGSLLP